MKIRVQGTQNELAALTSVLWSRYKGQIISISKFYPNRGNSVEGRIYIETTTTEFIGFHQDSAMLDFKL